MMKTGRSAHLVLQDMRAVFTFRSDLVRKGKAEDMPPSRVYRIDTIGEQNACTRCHGLMVPSFTDSLLVEITDKTDVPARRCVNCGNWVDETVFANRKNKKGALVTSQDEILPLRRRRWRWSVRLRG